MGMKGPGGPMAPLAFVPEGDPSMMGGPKAIEGGGEGEMVGEGGGEGFGGDPSDFADDAGANSHAYTCVKPICSFDSPYLQGPSRALG